jgi:hypothetical protein
MKKFVMAGVFVSMLAVSAFAESYKGYIADANCAAKGKAGSASHAECAAKCIKGGAAAVLVTSDGKIYKIADQDKVKEHAGHAVTIMGKAEGDTLTVDSVSMD